MNSFRSAAYLRFAAVSRTSLHVSLLPASPCHCNMGCGCRALSVTGAEEPLPSSVSMARPTLRNQIPTVLFRSAGSGYEENGIDIQFWVQSFVCFFPTVHLPHTIIPRLQLIACRLDDNIHIHSFSLLFSVLHAYTSHTSIPTLPCSSLQKDFLQSFTTNAAVLIRKLAHLAHP